MIKTILQFVDYTARVSKSTHDAVYRLVDKAAYGTRATAIESIDDEPGPSQPGDPPHTHTQRTTKSGKVRGGRLPRAIVYHSRQGEAVIGPRESVVGEAGAAHEHGEFKGDRFPLRPFMFPALEENLEPYGSSFEGSIGE